MRADPSAGLQDFQQGRFAEAHRSWIEAARLGDAASALYLGVQYDVGAGVAADPAQALYWYDRAAALGSVPAMFNLAVIYDAGRTVARDPDRAVRSYEQAAGFGYARAEFNLGLLFQYGDGVARDPAAARRWFGLAYSHGIPAALPHLVSLGAPPPRAVRAVPANRRADVPADTGMRAFDQAQAILLGRDPAQLHRAVTLFRASAEANNALAAYDLAYCYENAIGTPRNLPEAYRWYRRAVAQAQDDDLKQLARRNADLVAAQIPDAARRVQAEASY